MMEIVFARLQRKTPKQQFEDETVTNLKGIIRALGALYEKPLYRNCKNPVQSFAKIHCTVVAKIHFQLLQFKSCHSNVCFYHMILKKNNIFQ
jgi:hypothetical protein